MTLNKLEEELRSAIDGNNSLTLNAALLQATTLKSLLASNPPKTILLETVVLDASKPDALKLSGTVGENWPIKGIGSALTHIRCEFTFKEQVSSEIIAAELEIKQANILIAEKTLEFEGEVTTEGIIRCQLREGFLTPLFNLREIISFIGNSKINLDYLYGLDELSLVPLSGLYINFSFNAEYVTSSLAISNLSNSLNFIENFDAIEDVSIGFNVNHSTSSEDKIETSYGGFITGKIRIGETYNIRISPSNQRIWNLEVISENGLSLPSLSEISSWIGGGALATQVSNGMNALRLPTITLQKMSLAFDVEQKTLMNAMLNGHIMIGDIGFNITTHLPSFQFNGTMDSDSSINLKELVQTYFYASDNFPEIVLSEIAVNAHPSLKLYTLHIATSSSWEFNIAGENTIELTNLELGIDWIDGAIEGQIQGQVNLFEFPLYLNASQNTLGEGWLFTCKSVPEENLAILSFMEVLAGKFGIENAVPTLFDGINVYNIACSFNTQTKDFLFSFDTKLTIGEKEIDATIAVALTRNNGNYVRNFSGIIHIGDLEFNLIFNDVEDESSVFIATYQNASGKSESIHGLAALVTNDTDLLNIAESINFSLKDALLILDKENNKILFGLDIDGGINLSNLPLIGREFSSETTLQINLQPVLANSNFSKADLARIIPLIPSGGFQLPDTVGEGIGLNMHLLIGGQPIQLFLDNFLGAGTSPQEIANQTTDGNTTSTNISATEAPPVATNDVKWFTIQKTPGPVHFGQIGIQFKEGKLYFLLDASLKAANLTISLDGLYAASALNPIHPTFGLHGLGLDYKKGVVEIGGAFLRNTVTDGDTTYDNYEGAATIKTESFSLEAIGAYSYFNGHPSLFAYAFTQEPLGGPAFFFVKGLAVGFGYNRRLILPEVNDVQNFPLVQDAMADNEPNDAANPLAIVSRLHSYIPPATGEHFLAIGVRFTSFEIIDSFALLTASLNSSPEFNVVGLSTLQLPKGASKPLAKVKMALRAVYNSDKGYFKVRAALTPDSYILSRACSLRGGFAFYSWLKNGSESGAKSGDFVLTMGGYHPNFERPSHYPVVAPLTFNWAVSSHTKIKGDLYFALTPGMAMAGGNLEATWESGSIKASFNAGINLLIAWKPYFYKADVHVRVGASYTYHFFGTHHISAHIGANLSVWGPEFSGKVHVDLSVVSFTVGFGAGADDEPRALNWNAFKDAFLPSEESKWTNVSVKNGLIREIEDEDNKTIYVVNPEKVVWETHAAIPITTGDEIGDSNRSIGILPMHLTSSIAATHEITITKKGDPDWEYQNHLELIPIKEQVPSALWGIYQKNMSNEDKLGSDSLVSNACVGYRIGGAPPQESPNKTYALMKNLLNQYEDFNGMSYITYEEPVTPNGKWASKIMDNIESFSGERNEFIKKLGFEDSYFPNQELMDELILTSNKSNNND